MRPLSSLASRIFGVFAKTPFPSPLQSLINRAYVKGLGLDMGEFRPAKTYKSLNKLFTRALEHPRSLEGDIEDLISPCDAKVSAFGVIENNTALQIKKMPYSINSLLGDYILLKSKKGLEGGGFVNLYLSPKDYHRYHAPCRMKILEAHYIPGSLYPVNFTWLHKKAGLFCENERVVLVCENPFKVRFYLVFIGALNVGKMVFGFDERIQTNARQLKQQYYTYNNLWCERGDELGRFEMGSTIVILWEKDGFTCKVECEECVRFGQLLAKGKK